MSRLVGQAYQYLQRSSIPTNKFQRSLPRLKIPKLDKTCQRFVAALEPVFDGQPQLDVTKALVRDFELGPGKQLHESLLEYDKSVKHSSYISDFWFKMYLSSRLPLALNFNPFLAWRDADTPALQDQLVRGTNFVISAARFKRSLESNLLEPEVFHLNPKKTAAEGSLYKRLIGLAPDAVATYVSFAFKAFPLDMSQYNNLFNSTRLPQADCDVIVKSSDADANRHIVVLSRGRAYCLEIIDHNGDLKSAQFVYHNLAHIVSHSSAAEHQRQTSGGSGSEFDSICELTSAERNLWARERAHLASLSEQNRRNLARIDSAMFVLCLDDIEFGQLGQAADKQAEERQTIAAAHNFLHGAQPDTPLNRWFDKSFSVIVTKDGHAAINFEHSWGDGVAILRFFNDTHSDTSLRPQLAERPPASEPAGEILAEQLDFELDQRLRESVREARRQHQRATGQLELGALQYGELNRDYFKNNKLSPDAMSQLSFQLAFKRLYGRTPVTYESCSTAAFRGGRTETVRPCTLETNRASEAILARKAPKAELKALLQQCSQRHYQLCKEASMGDGFDRHLFAMRQLALSRGQQPPSLYSDPLFEASQHFSLSTSTLYGECFSGGGFAPVVPDGFGMGYGYVEQNFGVLVSSYKSHRNNGQFVEALASSLDDLRNIVQT